MTKGTAGPNGGSPFARFQAEAEGDESPVIVELLDRKGDAYVRKDGQPVTISVVGKYSKHYRAVDRRVTDKVLKAQRRRELDADDAEERYVERIAGACTAWTLDDADGKDVAFSAPQVVTFLKIAPWVAPQLQQAIEAHERFFGSSSPS